MTDLQTLRTALSTGDPAQDVVDRSRQRLQKRIHGRPAKRIWVPVGIGMTVTATAAAVAIRTPSPAARPSSAPRLGPASTPKR